MDKFVKDALDGIEEQDLNNQADAFAKAKGDSKKMASYHLTSVIMTGDLKGFVKILDFCKENNLYDTLKKYADGMFTGGFKDGWKAGRESMLGGVIYEPRPDTQRLPKVPASSGRSMP